MRIQHNIPAMNAYRNYNSNTKALQGNLQKLSSGYKINKAGDDAAGLAISEKMRAQITGLEVAQKNAKDGISLVQTAEGAMTEIHTMLNRMFSLAEQSANGTYADEVDREQLQNEFDALRTEIDRIADATNFNGKKLLDGKLDGDIPKATKTDAATAIFGAKNEDGTIAADNGAYLKGVTVKFGDNATEEQKAQINEDLAGNSIEVSLDNTVGASKQAIDANDTITFSNLPTLTGAKLQYTDKTGAAQDVVDGTALTFDTDLAVGNKVTLSIVSDEDGSTLGTIDVELDVATADSTNGSTGDTTVYFGSGDTQPTITFAPTTIDDDGTNAAKSTVSIDFTSADASFTDADKAALNDLLNGQSMKLTIKHAAASQFSNTDTIAFNYATGDAFKALIDDPEYQISYTSDNTTTTNAVEELSSTNASLAFVTAGTGGASNNVSAGGTSISFTISKGGKTLAELKITPDATAVATAANTVYTFSGGTSKATLDAAEAAKPEPTEPGEAKTGTALRLRVGDSIESYDDIHVAIKSMKSSALDNMKKGAERKVLDDLDINTPEGKNGVGGADEAMEALKGMINYVSNERGKLGATQNRLDHTINNLSTMQENIQDAEATIRDVDVAEEMMKYTKNNILVQSAQAMLAQANQLPQGVLQLLG